MAASTEPRSGIYYGWTLGESGWNGQMDANWLALGRFLTHLSVKDRDLTSPPGSPATGDTYIPAAVASGSWAGLEGKVVVWTGTTWAIGTPRLGWYAFIEDEGIGIVYTTSWEKGDKVNDLKTQLSPIAKTATATLTIAELLTKIITVTSASAVALTFPTGTLTAAGASMQIDTAFDWEVINLGSASGAVTMTAATDHTFVGNAVVAINTSASFRTRKVSSTTYITYRVS